MAKMFFLNNDKLERIKNLMETGGDGDFIILDEKNDFADIAQFCEDYHNVRLVTVPSKRLDRRQLR